MAVWTVVHLDHGGGHLDEFKPLNLEFSLMIDEADDVSYDLPLAHPQMRWFLMGPKRTDFLLKRDGQVIIAGIHSYAGSRRGSELANIQGKSWLWYLQNRHYPFDRLDPNKYLGGNLLPYRNNKRRKAHMGYQNYDYPGKIITDLLDITLARPNSLDLHYGLPNAGPKTYFAIQLADTESIYDKIQQLSEVGRSGEGEEGGFNFDVNPDKEFKIWVPSRYPQAARTNPGACIWKFDDIGPQTEMLDVEFQNNGPQMTHILTEGSGTAKKDPWYRTFGASDDTQVIFRRWDGTAQWSDLQDEKQFHSMSQMHYSAAMYPAITLPLKVKPEGIPGFWGLFKPGLAVWVNLDFEIRRVQQGFKINAIHGSVDNEGNEEVTLDLEQIMPLGNVGVNQG
jgi:hypothetical protein